MISKKSVDDVLQTAKVEEVISDYVNLKKVAPIYWGYALFIMKKRLLFLYPPQKTSTNVLAAEKLEGPYSLLWNMSLRHFQRQLNT